MYIQSGQRGCRMSGFPRRFIILYFCLERLGWPFSHDA
jgi:hypothetical protein